VLHKEREQQIVSILKMEGGFVSVKQLCDILFTSESSIRRDLKSLEQQGLLKRSYGGAVPATGFSNIVTFNHRTRQNANAKRQIAQKAAAMIADGSVLFLDQSSTAFYLAEAIAERSMLTVVTNNIEIMMLLSGTGIRLISSGGYLSGENRNCLVGDEAQRTFENIYADYVFFSVKAITEDGAVVDCSGEEVAVRRAMLQNAAKKVLLCDSSKFDGRAPFKQCKLEDVDILVSEGDLAQHFAAYSNRVKLL